MDNYYLYILNNHLLMILLMYTHIQMDKLIILEP